MLKDLMREIISLKPVIALLFDFCGVSCHLKLRMVPLVGCSFGKFQILQHMSNVIKKFRSNSNMERAHKIHTHKSVPTYSWIYVAMVTSRRAGREFRDKWNLIIVKRGKRKKAVKFLWLASVPEGLDAKDSNGQNPPSLNIILFKHPNII